MDRDVRGDIDHDYHKVYQQWLNADIPIVMKKELASLIDGEIKERFYKYIEFGTAGLRGELGAGTNRMNIYTIRRATQGLSQYICKAGDLAKKRGVVIAFDSRHQSVEFAEEAALILATNGIKSYLFEDIRPTPELSFAVRELNAISGIVITASHNPPEYNGFKVYWEDGGQISSEIASALIVEIGQVGNELEIMPISKETAISKGLLQIIGSEIDLRYQDQLAGLVLNPEIIEEMSEQIKIVYTPFHGTGNKPVHDILNRVGFKQVWTVPEQEIPDPNFSTVKSPNPEEKEAFQLAIQLAKEIDADLILGTDPDADRVGAVVQDPDGEYQVLTGNQTGALLIDYLLSQRKQKGNLPMNGVILKSIVTSDLGKRIAQFYGIDTINTLIGFKYIGEKIKEFNENQDKKFLFGFEESYGYLIGDFVRDKDAVQACLLIGEMAAYYKKKGLSLYNALLILYEKVGYFQEDLISITLKGIEGEQKIKRIIQTARENPITEIEGLKVQIYSDYLIGEKRDLFTGIIESTGLPKSDLLYFRLEDESWFAIRPSGTEPKLKIYLSVIGKSLTESKSKLNIIKSALLTYLKL